MAIIDVLDETKGNDLCKEFPFKGPHVIYKQCSVSDEVKLDSCMTLIKNEMGSLDLVINSAGVLDEQNPKRMIEINYVRIFVSSSDKIDHYTFPLIGRCCQLNLERDQTDA